MARAGVAPVATAADLVCGAFTPRHVAVCVFGAPIVPAAASATLASLARNVVAPLGRIHHTATLLVNVTVDDGHEREVVRKLLHEHFDGHQSLHAHVGLTSTIPPLSSCTSGSRTSHHHHADSSTAATLVPLRHAIHQPAGGRPSMVDHKGRSGCCSERSI